MILYLVCTSGGIEQSGDKRDGEWHWALDREPQTQMSPNPFLIGSPAFNDAWCMILYLVSTSGGTEQ